MPTTSNAPDDGPIQDLEHLTNGVDLPGEILGVGGLEIGIGVPQAELPEGKLPFLVIRSQVAGRIDSSPFEDVEEGPEIGVVFDAVLEDPGC